MEINNEIVIASMETRCPDCGCIGAHFCTGGQPQRKPWKFKNLKRKAVIAVRKAYEDCGVEYPGGDFLHPPHLTGRRGCK